MLHLHAHLRGKASPTAGAVDWMIRFQFGMTATTSRSTRSPSPALGDQGMAAYRAKLAEIVGAEPERTPKGRPSGADPSKTPTWSSPPATVTGTSRSGTQRLAVWDRDIDAIIITLVRDRTSPPGQDTAEALAEFGEFDLAIDWAKQATHFELGHQSVQAAQYWCAPFAAHHPEDEERRAWPCSAGGRPRRMPVHCTSSPARRGR